MDLLTRLWRKACAQAQRRPAVTRCGFAVAVVVSSATILWIRQTPNSLLGVDHFGQGLFQVGFWAAPGLAAYLWLARTPSLIVGEGLALLALFSWGWWESATDGHSTAAMGPFAHGWILAPCVVAGTAVVRVIRQLQQREPWEREPWER